MMRKIVLAVLVLLSIASLCHAKVETPTSLSELVESIINFIQR